MVDQQIADIWRLIWLVEDIKLNGEAAGVSWIKLLPTYDQHFIEKLRSDYAPEPDQAGRRLDGGGVHVFSPRGQPDK